MWARAWGILGSLFGARILLGQCQLANIYVLDKTTPMGAALLAQAGESLEILRSIVFESQPTGESSDGSTVSGSRAVLGEHVAKNLDNAAAALVGNIIYPLREFMADVRPTILLRGMGAPKANPALIPSTSILPLLMVDMDALTLFERLQKTFLYGFLELPSIGNGPTHAINPNTALGVGITTKLWTTGLLLNKAMLRLVQAIANPKFLNPFSPRIRIGVLTALLARLLRIAHAQTIVQAAALSPPLSTLRADALTIQDFARQLHSSHDAHGTHSGQNPNDARNTHDVPTPGAGSDGPLGGVGRTPSIEFAVSKAVCEWVPYLPRVMSDLVPTLRELKQYLEHEMAANESGELPEAGSNLAVITQVFSAPPALITNAAIMYVAQHQIGPLNGDISAIGGTMVHRPQMKNDPYEAQLKSLSHHTEAALDILAGSLKVDHQITHDAKSIFENEPTIATVMINSKIANLDPQVAFHHYPQPRDLTSPTPHAQFMVTPKTTDSPLPALQALVHSLPDITVLPFAGRLFPIPNAF